MKEGNDKIKHVAGASGGAVDSGVVNNGGRAGRGGKHMNADGQRTTYNKGGGRGARGDFNSGVRGTGRVGAASIAGGASGSIKPHAGNTGNTDGATGEGGGDDGEWKTVPVSRPMRAGAKGRGAHTPRGGSNSRHAAAV